MSTSSITQATVSPLDHATEAMPARSRRHIVAIGALATSLLGPLLVGIAMGGTTAMNLAGAAALFAMAIALGLRFESRWIRGRARQLTGGLIVFVGIFLVAWQWQVGNLWLNSQALLYCAIFPAFVALIAWFRRSREEGARLVFELKLGTVVGSSLLVIAAIWSLPSDPGAIWQLVVDPPVYGHLRHFNNDQLPGIAITIFFMSISRDRGARLALFLVLTAMGFAMAWSGGRGVMLSVGIFLALVAAFRVVPPRSAALAFGALGLGALLVLATGKSDLLLRVLKMSGSLNEISSNRMEIWLGSLSVWAESWASILFGFGPDAMRTTIRLQIGLPSIHQPHNGFVQVLTEFGVVGMCLFVVALAVIARRAIAILTSPRAATEARIAAALMIAFGAYMLNDGIIYHAVPFITVTFLTAYLFSLDGASMTAGNVRAEATNISPQSTGSGP